MELNTVFLGLLSTAFMGIGSLITLLLQFLLQQKQKISEEKFQFKFTRYKAISVQMYTLLNPEERLSKANRIRPDLDSRQSLVEELQAELYNAMLYASDGVLLTLKNFNTAPNTSSYLKVLIAMREDLWGKASKLPDSLLFESITDQPNDIAVAV